MEFHKNLKFFSISKVKSKKKFEILQLRITYKNNSVYLSLSTFFFFR